MRASDSEDEDEDEEEWRQDREWQPGGEQLRAPVMPPTTADGRDAAAVLAQHRAGQLGALAAAEALVQLSHVPQECRAYCKQMLAVALKSGKFKIGLIQPDPAAAAAGRGRQVSTAPQHAHSRLHLCLALVSRRPCTGLHRTPLPRAIHVAPTSPPSPPPSAGLVGPSRHRDIRRGAARRRRPRHAASLGGAGQYLGQARLPATRVGVLAYGAAAQQPIVSKASQFITRLGGKKPNHYL